MACVLWFWVILLSVSVPVKIIEVLLSQNTAKNNDFRTNECFILHSNTFSSHTWCVSLSPSWPYSCFYNNVRLALNMSTFLKNIVFRLNFSVKNKTPGIKYHRNKYITEDSYHFVSLCSYLAVSDILHSQAPVYHKTANLFWWRFFFMNSISKCFVNRLKNIRIFVWNMRAYHFRKDDLTVTTCAS